VVDTTALDTTAPAPSAVEVNRLAILDAIGSIVAINPDGTDGITIADAAEEGSVFFQPMWSPTSLEIAWGQANQTGSSLTVSNADGSDRRVAPMASIPFYLNWAPDGSRIGALHVSAEAGIELEIVDVTTSEERLSAKGSPFFFSWRPDASALVAHVGGIGLVTIDSIGETGNLGSTSAEYQAPQWTAKGILHLGGRELKLLDPAGDTLGLAAIPGPATFVASPDGTKVAILAIRPSQNGVAVARQSTPALPVETVVVLDLATRSIETVVDGPAMGFFWSPDSAKLMILRVSEAQGHLDVRVWQAGQSQMLGDYVPDFSFVSKVLPFFNQYAQSCQPWSPDSSEIALAGTIGQREGIWVQPLDGSPPRFIAEGTWVAWSAD
jgi:TolB protein